MRILGIDPGTEGALALFDPTKSPASGLRWIVLDMPVIVIEAQKTRTGKKKSGRKTQLNAWALRDWLRKHAPDHAVLEEMQFAIAVKGRGGQMVQKGLAGAMRFGALHGGVAAVLACCDIPTTSVQPRQWKEHFGLIGCAKEASRLKALQLFPDQSAMLSRKRDQNRAEAMLIADFASRLREAVAA